MTWIIIAGLVLLAGGTMLHVDQLLREQRSIIAQYRNMVKALHEQIDRQDDDMACLSQKLFAANNKIAMLSLQNEDLRKTIAVLTDAAEEE